MIIIEVKKWPESQEVMGNPDWFFVMSDAANDEYEILGSSAMARILDKSEYILTEDKTHTAGDIVYDNPLYDGEATTADEYNNKWLNENKYNEIKELITDLAWEMDRMSSSGRSTLADLWKILKIGEKQ